MSDFLARLNLIAPHVRTDLTLTQLRILGAVAENGDYTLGVKELATQLRVAKPYVTRVCDRLIVHKFLIRITDKIDRRQVKLALTAKGRAVYSGSAKPKLARAA